MRMRKKPNLLPRMERCAELLIREPRQLRGHWRKLKPDAVDLLREYVAPVEVDLLYINFFDPWPSHKHARRRLTHERFLVLYRGILKTGGQIHFKTDNRDLFEYSLFQFPKAGYALSEVTRDLHANGVCGVMTDYEEKFHQMGTPINRCVGTKMPMDPEPEYTSIHVPGGPMTTPPEKRGNHEDRADQTERETEEHE